MNLFLAVNNFFKDEKGTFTLSGLIIICVLSMLSFYLYDLSNNQTKSLAVLKAGITAKNFSISRAEFIIGKYKQDLNLWQSDREKVKNAYIFNDAIIVDEVEINDDFLGKISEKIYLMRCRDNIYILVVESMVDGIVNQICIYLEDGDGELIVQRWER